MQSFCLPVALSRELNFGRDLLSVSDLLALCWSVKHLVSSEQTDKRFALPSWLECNLWFLNRLSRSNNARAENIKSVLSFSRAEKNLSKSDGDFVPQKLWIVNFEVSILTTNISRRFIDYRVMNSFFTFDFLPTHEEIITSRCARDDPSFTDFFVSSISQRSHIPRALATVSTVNAS